MKSDSYYELKEEVTLALLKQFLPLFPGDGSNGNSSISTNICSSVRTNIYAKTDVNVSAYYLSMNSKHLDKRLVEIVFHDLDKVILHTLDSKVIGTLSRYGVLEKEARSSLISSYVNGKFY